MSYNVYVSGNWNIFVISVLPKINYRFNIIPVKIPVDFCRTPSTEIHIEMQRTRVTVTVKFVCHFEQPTEC